MAGGRCCWLLLLLTLLSVAAAASGLLRVSPSVAMVPASDLEEGSGDGGAVEEDGDTSSTALQPAQGKQDKLLDDGLPDQVQAFFNYGSAFALLTYITMGISYFYGPYSADAFLADKRAKHRMKYLKHQMDMEDEEEEETDYGHYVEEEVDSLLEHGGYGGEHGGHGGEHGGGHGGHGGGHGGFEQDSYVSYEGQIGQVSRVARRRGEPAVAPRPGPWRGAQDRRVWLNDDTARPQPRQNQRQDGRRAGQPQPTRRRQRPSSARPRPESDRRPQQDGAGVFKVFPRRQGYESQSQDSRPQTPTRQTIPAPPGRQQLQQRRRQTVQRVPARPQQLGGFRPAAPRPGQQPARPSQPPARPGQQPARSGQQQPAPEVRPVILHRQRQRQPGYGPGPAPRPTGADAQQPPNTGYQPAAGPTQSRQTAFQPLPPAAQETGFQPLPSAAAQESTAGRQTAPADQGDAPVAGEQPPTDRKHSTDGLVDMVKLIAGVDTSHPECRAWVRCLQNARHPDTPLGVRRGRFDDSDCSQYAASCPSKKP